MALFSIVFENNHQLINHFGSFSFLTLLLVNQIGFLEQDLFGTNIYIQVSIPVRNIHNLYPGQ